ncbi:MAG: hypothetical protein H6882_13020 [Rhodobiaceae bacterium]|nr:hypothetical protein [Rhodobiaceae bacterium]
MIELRSAKNEIFTLFANDMPVAKGEVMVEGERIRLRVVEMLHKPPEMR